MTERIPEFYPDSDDTYLLIDSLEKDLKSLRSTSVCGIVTVEIGPGGGLVSQNFLKITKNAGLKVFHIAVDVNIHAARETRSQCDGFGTFDIINGDMFTWSRQNFKADIIFCNPPYVPSSPINRARDIRASYAGGELGREFIDEFLPVVANRLAPHGVFYLLLERRNNPEEVRQIAREKYNMESELVLEKRIPGEHLYVYKFRFT
jgi:release factor glutamine methyltransferase